MREKVLQREIRERKAELGRIKARKKARTEKLLLAKAIHSVFRTGEWDKFKFIGVCGAKVIVLDSEGAGKFKNASYCELEVNCKKCKSMMRPHAGDCPKCKVPFDNQRETYCGNCGQDTRKPYKTRRPSNIKGE